MYLVVVVQSLSCVWLFVTSWTAHARLPCPSLSPGVCSNSRPLSWWWHLTISSFLFLLSIFPSIRNFFNESVLVPGNVPGTCSKNPNHAGRYKMKNESSFPLPPPPRSSQNLSSSFFQKIIYIYIWWNINTYIWKVYQKTYCIHLNFAFSFIKCLGDL